MSGAQSWGRRRAAPDYSYSKKCPYPLKIHIEIFMAEIMCLGFALRQCSREAIGGVIDLKKKCLLADDDYS